MSEAALLVAGLSLVVSGLALGWQVASWLLSGGRLKTELRHGVIGRGGVAAGAIGASGRRHDLSSLRSQGWDGPEVIGVQVTNVGRSRVQVVAFGMRQGRKGLAINYPAGNAMSPDLPSWVEPGSSLTWWAELADGQALIQATGQTRLRLRSELRMTVSLGSGQTMTTRRRIRP